MEAACRHLLNLLLLLSLSLLSPRSAFAADTLGKGSNITGSETLVSADGTFTMGFFSPGVSAKIYLGIWFTVSRDAVCWVANRDRPINDKAGALVVSDTGSLFLLDGFRQAMWSSNTTSTTAVEAQLLDNGNLVVRNRGSNTVLWQSFDNPSNVMVSGMKVGTDFSNGAEWHLTSWRSTDDPAPGDYRRVLDTSGGVPDNVVWQGNVKTFRTGPWNGLWFSGIPEVLSYENLIEYQMVISRREITYGYNVKPGAPPTYVVLTENGMVKRQVWDASSQAWQTYYQGPRDVCDNYGKCGAFGICNSSAASTSFCGCLKGFVLVSPSEWKGKEASGGCRRNIILDCGGGRTTDGFQLVHGVKLPDTHNAAVNMSITVEECRARCLANCSCVAYAAADISGGGVGTGCIIWVDSLMDLRYVDGGQDLYLRLAKPELGPEVRSQGQGKGKKLARIFAPVFVIGFLILTLVILCWTGILDWWNMWHMIYEHKWPADPLIDLATVKRATRNFSRRNKIGEGAFGIVYEGKLPRRHPLVQGLPGRDIAVKRLKSKRGSLPPAGIVDYFTREVELMSGLQNHENVLKFLAYCKKGNERILVYEYMHRKSLDVYIFGNMQKRALLDWERRLDIVQGIANGVNYLSSRNVIHRDLKLANVLLDDEWKAKVADFGTAKLLVPDATGTGTRIGTPGYVAPEYVQDEGQATLKCDVYSFGVMLLETLSGRRNIERRNSEGTSLVAHAWELWQARHELNILTLLDSAVAPLPANLELVRERERLSRCIQIGLLCVQTEPDDRPSMSQVVEMLSNTNGDLPLPKPPMRNLPALHEADTSTPTVYETVADVNLRWRASDDAETSDRAGTSGVTNDPGSSGATNETVTDANDDSSKLL